MTPCEVHLSGWVCGLDGKRKKERWDDKKRVKNREGSLGYPGFVTPVFTKDSKPLGKEKITRAPRDCDTRTHLKKVSPLRGRLSGYNGMI
ncbi:hypothetical protein TNCV_4661571 [Trichonephila clavipes]|uniref:Uncharacterized protein n=1 Tax=Trichonephila clavipes TaxID=2585209 RepID=A0A8X6S9G9_TRICX|nr:hypothetical protein TNCV_4661571 [Trichonephila clavipes]